MVRAYRGSNNLQDAVLGFLGYRRRGSKIHLIVNFPAEMRLQRHYLLLDSCYTEIMTFSQFVTLTRMSISEQNRYNRRGRASDFDPLVFWAEALSKLALDDQRKKSTE